MVPVTSFYAALGALLILLLVYAVVQRRMRARVGLGDGGDAVLARRIRAHGNAIETLPLGLLLLLLLELGGLATWALHGFGAVLLVSRMLHAWGLSRRSGTSPGRFLGMLLTLIVVLAMALTLLWRVAMLQMA
jgi:uncharacterized protein